MVLQNAGGSGPAAPGRCWIPVLGVGGQMPGKAGGWLSHLKLQRPVHGGAVLLPEGPRVPLRGLAP